MSERCASSTLPSILILIGYSSLEWRQLDAVPGAHPIASESFYLTVSAVAELCGWKYYYTTW
jgi:hypothetical protein